MNECKPTCHRNNLLWPKMRHYTQHHETTTSRTDNPASTDKRAEIPCLLCTERQTDRHTQADGSKVTESRQYSIREKTDTEVKIICTCRVDRCARDNDTAVDQSIQEYESESRNEYIRNENEMRAGTESKQCTASLSIYYPIKVA